MAEEMGYHRDEIHRIQKHWDKGWVWRWPRKTFLYATKRIIIDLGFEVFEMFELGMDKMNRVILHGRFRSRKSFMKAVGLREPPDHQMERPIGETLAEKLLGRLDGYLGATRDRGFAFFAPSRGK